MPFSADQINQPFVQTWKKKSPMQAITAQIINEPVSITVPQVMIATLILPLLPTLPPCNH